MKNVFCGLVSVGLLLCITGQTRAEFSFTTIDVPNSNFTQAFEINNIGQLVGLYRVPSNGGVDHGYLLTEGNYVLLAVTSANAINNSGQIVGEIGRQGFLLSGGSYTVFDVPGSTFTQPLGINDAGHIVGVYGAAGGNHSFLLSGGAYTTLDVPGASFTQANGINNSDEIVGYYVAGGQFHGFLLSAGRDITLDFPGSTFTRAYGINDAGQIVGDYELGDGIRHGFLLSAGSYTTLDFPGSPFTIAAGLNNIGQVVGEYAGGGTSHGFLATPVTPVPGVIKVSIDIKPGELPNSINPRSRGVIPVAILSTGTFDATTVNPLSVRFGPSEAQAARGEGHVEDVNGDGKPDLVLHFRTQETGTACGDTSAFLTGGTVDRRPIQGSASIKTVGCTK